MADVNRGNRPLSPHLQVYRMPMAAILSILHRLTGIALAAGALLVVWWFLAAATGPGYFATADGLLTSVPGTLVMIGALWALAYHLLNGLRHLWWDLGEGFAADRVKLSGQAAAAGSAILTVLVLLAARS